MKPRDAVEFLAQQATLQAEREGKPLDALEQRMLRWSEVIPGLEHSVELNDEFEREHDSSEFESKICGLLQRAYEKEEEPAWVEALNSLRGQDAYVLVMIPKATEPAQSLRDQLRLLFWGVVVAAVFAAIVVAARFLGK